MFQTVADQFSVHARGLQYSFVCLCVSLTTLEAALIYGTKNGHQWTANGIIFIFKKLKFCKSAPSIQKQLSKLTALYHTSYGHAHLLKFKVHFKGKASAVQWSYPVLFLNSPPERWEEKKSLIHIDCTCAGFSSNRSLGAK